MRDGSAQTRLSVDLSGVAFPPIHRFRYSNMLIIAGVLVIVWYSGNGTGVAIQPFFDANNQKQVGNFISHLFPPDLSADFMGELVPLIVQTFQISVIGTVLAILIGAPLGLLAMRQRGDESGRSALGTGWWVLRSILYVVVRALLNTGRAVPELVWALIAITFVGLGPFAGVVALTIHSAGILGKLYAEIFEAVDLRLVDIVRGAGANRLQTLAFAHIPVTLPLLLSYTMFRWECNMRAATVLGFVGAGGLGQQLLISMKVFDYPQVTTCVIALLVLVTLVDMAGQFLRKRILDTPESSACRPGPADLVGHTESIES